MLDVFDPPFHSGVAVNGAIKLSDDIPVAGLPDCAIKPPKANALIAARDAFLDDLCCVVGFVAVHRP